MTQELTTTIDLNDILPTLPTGNGKKHGFNVAYEGTITARTAIAHGGESKGTTTTLNEIEVVQSDGRKVSVFYISGNSIRGHLRDICAYDMCAMLGIEDVSRELLQTLFNGGALSKTGKRGIDLALQRAVADLIPGLSLFGAAFGNSMIESPLKVSWAWPICQETIDSKSVPNHYADEYEQSKRSNYELRGRVFFTNMEDTKKQAVARLLPDAEKKELQETLIKQMENADKPDSKEEREERASTQMRASVQVVLPGTVFYHKFTLTQCTALQHAAFVATIARWYTNPTLGGKSGSGLGLVELNYNQLISPRFQSDAEILSGVSKAVSDYTTFMQDNRREILNVMGKLAAV